MRSGVRCAETTPTSKGTSNSASAWAAASITGQSLSLPMIKPTRGPSFLVMSIPSVCPFRVRQPVCRPLGSLTHVRDVPRVVGRTSVPPEDVDVPDLAARAFFLAVEVNTCLRDAPEQMMQPLVKFHRRRLRRAEHICHHGQRRYRRCCTQRIVQHYSKMLLELTGGGPVHRPVPGVVRSHREFVDQNYAV